MSKSQTTLFILLCFYLILAIGCSNPHPGRSNVSGKITLNGEPIVLGTISFQPETPDSNVSIIGAQSQIVNGAYSITDGLGLFAGNYKVRIQSQRYRDKRTKQILPEQPDDPNIYTVENVIPEQFNTKTEIVFTVEEKAGDKTFDYDIPIQ